jgi:hypothetical protein
MLRRTVPDWCQVHGHQEFFLMYDEEGNENIACPECYTKHPDNPGLYCYPGFGLMCSSLVKNICSSALSFCQF